MANFVRSRELAFSAPCQAAPISTWNPLQIHVFYYAWLYGTCIAILCLPPCCCSVPVLQSAVAAWSRLRLTGAVTTHLVTRPPPCVVAARLKCPCIHSSPSAEELPALHIWILQTVQQESCFGKSRMTHSLLFVSWMYTLLVPWPLGDDTWLISTRPANPIAAYLSVLCSMVFF